MNVHPCTMALPASICTAAEPTPRLSQLTKWHALAVNWPLVPRMRTHRSIGPQNAQLTRLTLPPTSGPMSTHTASPLLHRPTNSPLEISRPGGCACSTTTARSHESAPRPRKFPFAQPSFDSENL